MDQPYSRIADALLDRQYWSPDDPQKHPYDDTGWSFPALFDTEAVRVTDRQVLAASMSRAEIPARPRGGVTGGGPVFVVAQHGDDAMFSLRYALGDAKVEAASEPFKAGGHDYPRGTWLVRGIAKDAFDRAATDAGVTVETIAAAPKIATRPIGKPRIALLHTWLNTQTEGWWRQRLDLLKIPYTYLSTQDVAADANLAASYDVILFPPVGVGDPLRIVNGLPMWGEPMPWKTTPETPNLGKIDATDDQRPGLGFAGLDHLRQFVQQGGLLVGVEDTAQLMIATGLAPGVRVANPKNLKVVGSVLDARFPDPTSPLVAGLGDRLSVYSAEGMSFELSNAAAGGWAEEETDRPTGRGGPKDTDTPQGRPAQPRTPHPHKSRALGSPPARDRRAAQQPLRDPRGPPAQDPGPFRRRRRPAGLRPARGRRRAGPPGRSGRGAGRQGVRAALRHQPGLAGVDGWESSFGVECDFAAVVVAGTVSGGPRSTIWIIIYPQMTKNFDVFLCYNRKDRHAALELGLALRAREVKVWFDGWELVPGRRWQEALETIMEEVGCAAVLVGKYGLGQWEQLEVRTCLEESIGRGLPIIPVFLPGASDKPILPSFLRHYTWIDLRSGLTDEGLKLLQWGITGKKPGPVTDAPKEADKLVAEPLSGDQKVFFHQKVLATIETHLDESSDDICVIGLPGCGTSTILRQLVQRRPDVWGFDSHTFPKHEDLRNFLPSDGVIAVRGYPSVDWLAKLQTLVDPKRVRIVAGSAVAPKGMKPVLMTPLGDDDLLSMLVGGWKKRVQDVARVTGRSPSAVRRLLCLVPIPNALSLREIQEQIWDEAEVDKATRALADLDHRERTFLATLAVRGSINPVGKELWTCLLTAASMDRYRKLDAQNPLSPFLLPMEDGGVHLKPEIARAIEKTNYAEALPRLGLRVIHSLSHALEMHKLISTIGSVKFRGVLDDARTIAFTQVPPCSEDLEAARVNLVVRAGPLESEEEIDVKTKWRVLAHVVQLLPTSREPIGGLQLWNQLLSAIIRSRDIDVRLNGAEMLQQNLLLSVQDQLRPYPHWSLMWSKEAIPGPLINEMLHHDPGIIPEVNAVVFGREIDRLWSADSAGFVHKWNWRSGRGSKLGQEKVQQGEVWSIAVIDEGAVLSASDDGSIAVRLGAQVDKHQVRLGSMINTVVATDGIVVAGDDDSMLHLWRLIVEDDGPTRLVGREYIGNADAGWTLACLAVSQNEVYSSHADGVICRWVRDGCGSWSKTSIRITDGYWVRTLRRNAISGTIFAACGDGKVFQYDPTTNLVQLFAEHGASIRGLALVDPEVGVFLATGGDDGVVRLWTAAGDEVSSFGAHRGMIRALDSRGSLLVSSGTDGFARVWDIRPSVLSPRMEVMDADDMVVQFVAAGKSRAFLASTGSETCLVKGLGTPTTLPVSGREISTQRGEIELPTICFRAMLSSDESRVLASDIGGRIYLFRWSSG